MVDFTRRAVAGAIAAGMALGAVLVPGATPAQAQSEPIKIAFGDIATVETLGFLAAIERTKEAGVPVDVTFFKSEDVAAQAVVSGQSDIGVGTPYALLQKVKAPIRMFYRLSRLRFFPVVNTEAYKDWKDLDGQEITVHSRGSGTEALMKLMAQKKGIEYAGISYVPGSEVRAGAMLQGNIKATIVDASAWRLLQEKGGDKFKVLPMEGVDATDEALYANTSFLEKRKDDVTVLVEQLLKTWQEINKNPEVVADLREKYGLLPDLPSDLEGEVVTYYKDAVANDLFPNDGGSPDGAKSDFEFYTAAGQLQGEAGDLKVDDFWDFDPLDAAHKGMK